MRVPVHGAVFNQDERDNLLAIAKADDLWLTAGPWCAKFERGLREFTGQREVVLCNSGSSANLLAISALTAPELGDRRIMPGDEVITTALNFPTTLNPILQIGAVPVLIDVTLPGLVADTSMLQAALSPRTKAVIFAHTLGYPFDVQEVKLFCEMNNLWLIEDCCDALGTPGIMQGDMSTLSFYPAHQITTGEGGAVLTQSPKLAKLLRSFRDWGKDCWCEPGKDDTCGRRFAGEYDHKYTFSHVGYNLKMSDLHAAVGVAQLEKLDKFISLRDINYGYLWANLIANDAKQFFDFIPPQEQIISWFGFTLICKPPVKRNDITRWLEGRGIQTRIVFAGNVLRQPAYQYFNMRVIGDLPNTNRVHDDAFWVGCWPGLTQAQLDYVVENIKEYCDGL